MAVRTAKQKAALRKAQLVSARKRKGKGRAKSSSRRRRGGSRTKRWAKAGAIGYGAFNGVGSYLMTGSVGYGLRGAAVGAAVGAGVGAAAAGARNLAGRKRRGRR